MLSAYCYRIQFKAGKLQENADALSRLPLPEEPTASEISDANDTVLMLEALEDTGSPVTVAAIKEWTSKDPVLS